VSQARHLTGRTPAHRGISRDTSAAPGGLILSQIIDQGSANRANIQLLHQRLNLYTIGTDSTHVNSMYGLNFCIFVICLSILLLIVGLCLNYFFILLFDGGGSCSCVSGGFGDKARPL